jgi:hypothetical protein
MFIGQKKTSPAFLRKKLVIFGEILENSVDLLRVQLI